MEDLLTTIARGLVKKPDEVKVEVDEADAQGVIVYHLHVDPDDMGRVIGKQGRIAKEIRVLMRSVAARDDLKIMVEID